MVRDVAWYGTDGSEISDEVWSNAGDKSIAMMLNGKTIGVMDDDGNPVEDDSFLILVNASDNGVEYTLPEPPNQSPWRQVLDTESIQNPFCEAVVEQKVILGGRTVRVYIDGDAPEKRPVRPRPTRTV